MLTEEVPLYVKGVFDRKKVKYHKHDVARMRRLCTIFIEFVLDLESKPVHKNICNIKNKGVSALQSSTHCRFQENETI